MDTDNFTFIIIKFILMGILLPAFDLGTDLLAVYQTWTSSQWILRYLAVGLCSSIVVHNVLSAIYGLRILSKLNKPNIPFMHSLGWKILSYLGFCMGLGNVILTVEIMAEIQYKAIFQKQKIR